MEISGYRVYPGLVALESRGLFGGSGSLKDSVDPFNDTMTYPVASGNTNAVNGSEIGKLNRGRLEDVLVKRGTFVGLSTPSRTLGTRQPARQARAPPTCGPIASGRQVRSNKDLKEPKKSGVAERPRRPRGQGPCPFQLRRAAGPGRHHASLRSTASAPSSRAAGRAGSWRTSSVVRVPSPSSRPDRRSKNEALSGPAAPRSRTPRSCTSTAFRSPSPKLDRHQPGRHRRSRHHAHADRGGLRRPRWPAEGRGHRFDDDDPRAGPGASPRHRGGQGCRPDRHGRDLLHYRTFSSGPWSAGGSSTTRRPSSTSPTSGRVRRRAGAREPHRSR